MNPGTWLDVVDSTLDELHTRAAAGAADGTWVVAAEQRAGRGSRGRTWHSPRGGLWLSVLRRSGGTIGGFELLSLRAGLAVAGVLDGLPPIAPVMLGDAALASKFAEKLLERGVYVIGFGYPVVPEGHARLRVQISAAHETTHIDKLIQSLGRLRSDQ